MCVKSGLKQEKSSVQPFKLHSSFFTRVEGGGGSEAPIRRMARWGVLANFTEPLLRILTSILVYVFTITFAWFVWAVANKQF